MVSTLILNLTPPPLKKKNQPFAIFHPLSLSLKISIENFSGS